jgi:putative MFS transporter
MVGGGQTASIFAPFLVGWGIAAFGATIPLLATAGLWVGTITGYLIGPETRGKELEDVQL